MGKYEINDKFLKTNETNYASKSIENNSKIEFKTNKIISFLLRFNMVGAIWLPEKLHFIIRTIFKNDPSIETLLKNSALFYSLCAAIIFDCSSLTFDEIGLNREKLSESISCKIEQHFTNANIGEIKTPIDFALIDDYCSNKYAYVSMTSGLEI